MGNTVNNTSKKQYTSRIGVYKGKKQEAPKSEIPKMKINSEIISVNIYEKIKSYMSYREKGLVPIRLFSSFNDGKSFTKMVDKIMFRGPTLMIVNNEENNDDDGYFFGCYCMNSWKDDQNNFFGESNNIFLFYKDKNDDSNVIVHKPSSYNKNYQYFNINEGFCVGGQLNYFTFQICSDFETINCNIKTSSYPKCPFISGFKVSKLKNIEVFGWELSEKDKLNLDYKILMKNGAIKNKLEEEDNADLFILKKAGVIKDQ